MLKTISKIALLILIISFHYCTFAQSANDILKPRLVIDPQGHSGVVNDLQFTPDGKSLISVSSDKTIRIWDTQEGSLKRTIRTLSGTGPDGAIYAAALSSDGQYLAIGGYFPENEIRIININRDQDVITLKGHQNIITKLVFSSNDRLLASTGADKSVKIWQISFDGGRIRGKMLQNLTGHEGQIFDISFAPDGSKIVSASADGSLRLWDLNNGKPPVIMKMHIDQVYSCAFSPDGKYIISGGKAGKIIAWNNNGTFRNIVGTMNSAVAHLDFTSDNKLFSSARSINAYSIPSGTLIGVIPQQDKNITASAIYKNRYFATSASATGKIIIRDLQKQSTISTLAGNGIMPLEVASNNNGTIAIGSRKNSLSIAFDLKSLKFLFANFDKTTFEGSVTEDAGYSLTKLDQYTLSTGFKGSIKNDPGIDGRILKFTIIDGNTIAVGSDYSIKLYTRDGEFIRSLSGANGAVMAMVVDHKLNYLITATTDETVRIWNIDNGENLASLFFSHNNDWICWTPSGYYHASSGGEKYLGWLVNKGVNKLAEFYPAYVFAKNFHQPKVVQQALRLGNENEALAYLNVKEKEITSKEINVSNAAPEIVWVTPEKIESTANKTRVLIKAKVNSSSAIKTIKILINGRPAPKSRGIDNQAENNMMVEQEILLLNEVNKIKIFVSNENARTVSEERIITLSKDLLKGQVASNTQVIDYTARPDLYILGVGVSDYANSSYNLTFADDDVEAITELFKNTGKGAYKQIHVEQVVNKEATKKQILNSFAWLKQNATSKDVVVIFIASHGFNDRGEFYILPYDGDANNLEGTGISWNNLSNTLGNMPAKVLLMVDACHSGQLGTNVEHEESNNTEAVREISDEENGVVIMAASTGDETSQEFADWGHGAFTLSVLEGLAQGKADIKKDMTIFLRELDFYVSERTLELTNGQQHPTTQKPSSISRFPVITLEN